MVTKKRKAASTTGEQQVLARVVKEALKSGKFTIGAKEVISEMKTSKLVIAATLPSGAGLRGDLTREAEKAKVPVVVVASSSSQLGRMMGKPFRVSAVGLRVVAEGDFRELVGSPSKAPKAE